MKRLMTMVAAMVVLCVLTGCEKEMPYEIVKGDGAYYIVTDGKTDIINPGRVPFLVFNDLKDMKYRMLNGYLSDEQLTELSYFSRDEEGRIKIPDLDKLWNITHPKDLHSWCVYMESTQYRIGLKADGMPGFFVTLRDQAYFDKEMEGPTFGSKIEVEQYWDAERNAQVYLYQLNDYQDGEVLKVPYKKVFYTITEGQKTFCVTELYELSVSETIPVDVKICFSDNGKYLSLYMADFNELPTADWITQFGYCEYEQ